MFAGLNRWNLAFTCLLILSSCMTTNCWGRDKHEQLMVPGANLGSQLVADAIKHKSDAGYTVQGKPVTKQQYEAVKFHDEGLLLLRSNDNEQALAKFKQSIAVYDGYAEVHHSLGIAYAKLGNKQDAIKELKRATELNPNQDESWLLLAGFCQAEGSLQESVKDYNEYLRRFPGTPMASKVNATLGLLYARLGKSDQAIDELKHSIELNPDLAASWITLGGVYQAKGDIEDAIDTYTKFKEKFPKDPMLPKINGLLSALNGELQSRERTKNQDRLLQGQGGDDPMADTNNNTSGNNEAIITPAFAGKDDYLAAMTKSGVKRWPSTRIPISVYISDGSKFNGYRDSFKSIVKRSLEDWAKASSGEVSFIIVDSPTAAKLKCFWTDRSAELHNPSEAGDARLTEDQDSISNAEIWFLTVPLSKSMPLTDNVFRLIALHEVGHALGLNGHTTNPDDIMFYSTTFKDTWRELTGRDARSITKLYAPAL